MGMAALTPPKCTISHGCTKLPRLTKHIASILLDPTTLTTTASIVGTIRSGTVSFRAVVETAAITPGTVVSLTRTIMSAGGAKLSGG